MQKQWHDFNNVLTNLNTKESVKICIADIKSDLLYRISETLYYLFPSGSVKSRKFYIGDVYGNKGSSLVIEMSGDKAGQWYDFATGCGGDIISLWAIVHGKDATRDFPEVISSISKWLGNEKYNKDDNAIISETEDFGQFTCKWDYHDSEGNLIACVYRYDTKNGKQFRPWDVKTRRNKAPEIRPLYNQPGIKSSDYVILVEGEKSAKALIDIGICATTAMNGANAPIEKTDWAPLCGKKLIIWPDNDIPGFSYAKKVLEHVRAIGVTSLFILNIPKDKPEKWDAADAILDGLNIWDFIEKNIGTESNKNTPIQAFSVGHYLDDETIMPEDIISPRILTPGGLLVLGGAPKVGKSDFLIHWLANMSIGESFIGMKTNRPLKIFYLQSEIGYFYLRERLRNVVINPELLHLFRTNIVITPQIKMLLDEKGIENLIETICSNFNPSELDVVVIDPLRNVYEGGKAGGENDNYAMISFLQNRIEFLRQKINPNLSIIIVHHTKKVTKQLFDEDPFQSFAGASSLRGFYTTGMMMYHDFDDKNKKSIVFELRNGPGINKKIIEKKENEWVVVDDSSVNIVRSSISEKFEAERRRKADVILQILDDEALLDNFYTCTNFCNKFEGISSLGGREAIKSRIDVLISKGYIKFFENRPGYNGIRRPSFYMCTESMVTSEVSKFLFGDNILDGNRRVLPTHFKDTDTNTFVKLEDRLHWKYLP